MNTTQFITGKDGFIWFTGVVESRDDPDKLGRVRVRAVGYHTEDKTDIPTEDLPWAWVMNPTTVPSMGGMGETPPFLVEGSWVLGFFRDPPLFQEPIILGSLPGFNLELPDGSKGFNDPDAVYPKTVNENDVNRLAQGLVGETHPSLYTRKKSQIQEVPIATKPYIPTVEDAAVQESRSTWNELDAKSNTTSFYPFNHVHESESGHIHKIDDSPEGERLFTYHRSGTFEEIHPDGSKVVKIVGDDYEIIAGSRNCYVKGSVNLTVDGNVSAQAPFAYTKYNSVVLLVNCALTVLPSFNLEFSTPSSICVLLTIRLTNVPSGMLVYTGVAPSCSNPFTYAGLTGSELSYSLTLIPMMMPRVSLTSTIALPAVVEQLYARTSKLRIAAVAI